MFGVRAARVVFSFSLLLGSLIAGAMTHEEMLRRLESARGSQEIQRVLDEANEQLESDDDFWDQFDRVDPKAENREDLDRLIGMLRTRAIADRVVPPKGSDPGEIARKIKENPVYYDPGLARSSNWISRAFERLGEWLRRIRLPERKIDTPELGAAPAWGNLLISVVWLILGAGVLAFLIWGIRTFSWKRAARKKRIAALLEEDEPERSADEWLTRAAELETEGRYREAVRCLYLACLVRLDEANVARFIRSETNWEHLARIEASPRRPAELDFRTPTRRFDTIWYGFQTRGAPDLEDFRATYRSLCETLNQRKSA